MGYQWDIPWYEEYSVTLKTHDVTSLAATSWPLKKGRNTNTQMETGEHDSHIKEQETVKYAFLACLLTVCVVP